jgi:hypothetical protein
MHFNSFFELHIERRCALYESIQVCKKRFLLNHLCLTVVGVVCIIFYLVKPSKLRVSCLWFFYERTIILPTLLIPFNTWKCVYFAISKERPRQLWKDFKGWIVREAASVSPPRHGERKKIARSNQKNELDSDDVFRYRHWFKL